MRLWQLALACVALASISFGELEMFSGGLSSAGFFSMSGSSYEREEESAAIELGEALQHQSTDDKSVDAQRAQGADAQRVAQALDLRSQNFDRKAEETLIKAKAEMRRFQALAKQTRLKASNVRKVAARRIQAKRNIAKKEARTLDTSLDLSDSLGESSSASGKKKKDKKKKKDDKKKTNKEDKKKRKEKRKGKIDKAQKDKQMQNEVVDELQKAFTILLRKVNPVCPIDVQTVVLNVTESEGGELGESDLEGSDPCSRANRPPSQTKSQCLKNKCWNKYQAQIRAASDNTTQGIYKSGTGAQETIAKKVCKTGCMANVDKEQLRCDLVLKAAAADSKKCTCLEEKDERALGFADILSRRSAEVTELGETGRRRKKGDERVRFKASDLGLKEGGGVKFPVTSFCELKYLWPSYMYTANDTNATGSNTSTIVPKFGDCKCSAQKKATCTFTKPAGEDDAPSFTCKIEKSILNCAGSAKAEVATMNETQRSAFNNEWCATGFSGL